MKLGKLFYDTNDAVNKTGPEDEGKECLFSLFNLATTGTTAVDRIIAVQVSQFAIDKDGNPQLQYGKCVYRKDVMEDEHARSVQYHGIPFDLFQLSGLSREEFFETAFSSFWKAGNVLTYNTDFAKKLIGASYPRFSAAVNEGSLCRKAPLQRELHRRRK